jgi:hypothetical protein
MDSISDKELGGGKEAEGKVRGRREKTREVCIALFSFLVRTSLR